MEDICGHDHRADEQETGSATRAAEQLVMYRLSVVLQPNGKRDYQFVVARLQTLGEILIGLVEEAFRARRLAKSSSLGHCPAVSAQVSMCK